MCGALELSCTRYGVWDGNHFKNMTTLKYVDNTGQYSDYMNLFALQVIKMVDKGYRLAPPPGCPEAVYRLMMKCW
jgi:hypothetical protein